MDRRSPFVKVLIGAALVASPSYAQGEAEDGATTPPSADSPRRVDRTWRVEVGALADFTTGPIRGGTTPFGPGFGARFGLALSGPYFGASVVDYLGGHDVNVSDHALLFGVDVGYSFRWVISASSQLVLRPTLGVGDAAVSHKDPNQTVDVVTSASGAAPSDTTTVHNVYLRPGVGVLVDWAVIFAGLRGAALVLPGIRDGSTSEATTWFSYTLGGELGVRF